MNRFQLDDMLTRWMAGELTDEELARLEAVLEAEPESRQRLRQHAMLDDMLREMGEAKPEASTAKPALPIVESLGGWGVTSSLVFFSTLVVCLAIWWWQRPGQQPDNPPREVAVEPQPAHQLPTVSQVKLASGATELELPGIGKVIVEGKSDFQLIGPKRARLTEGRIKFRITGKAGHGFVVETPYGEVTDLGTEFGLDVSDKGKAGLVVFEGMVDLRMAKEPQQAPALRLVGGDGVTFDKGGQLDRIMSIVTGKAATFQPADEPVADDAKHVSTGIRDNLPASDTKRFYEIVRGGFGEDARAYVDRNYEWNGLDEAGIPEFLRGADYILPFNDDKGKKLEITLSVGRPATVYIMFDDRGKPPKWLQRDFVDTGFDIGMDEDQGPPGNMRPTATTGRGPGKSVDYVFSIWKREVNVPGQIVLGSREGARGSRSMYGIAVVPLQPEQVAMARAR
jgi:ferric-dicitrate binding protein FerR (iron transport regulator)